jgi:hypothetical protein
MLSAGICRDVDIRSQFDKVLWVTLGQSPSISNLQQLLYLQCTGSEPPADSTVENMKEALQQKMAAHKVSSRHRPFYTHRFRVKHTPDSTSQPTELWQVLLVVDDCWDQAHEAALNTVNPDSKVLVTTRIKGLLAGAEQVRDAI